MVSNKKRKIKNISKNDIINLLSSSSCVECIDSDKEIFQTKIHCLSSAADKAYRILVNLGKPTHYRQIVKIINKQEATSSHDASLTRNITNQMVTDKRFTPIGKSGEWGLSEWNSVPNISSKDLMIKALHKKGEPMKAKEIHNEITKIRENIPLSSVNTYLVSHKDIFIRVDRGLYALKAWKMKEHKDEKINNNVHSLDEAASELFKEKTSMRFAEAVRELMKRTNYSEINIRQRLRASPNFKFKKIGNGKSLIIECINSDFQRLSKTEEKETLRERIYEEIRTILYSNPNKPYQKGVLYKMISEQVECIKPTFYNYLSEMNDIESYQENNKTYAIYRNKEISQSISIDIESYALKENLKPYLNRAITKLNIDEIDIGLFELGRIFETELKNYLSNAKDQKLITVSNNDLSSLVNMINCVVREKVMSKGYVLHILREERNDRAHGKIPTLDERKILLNKAHYLVDKYIEYISFFNSKY